MVVTSRNYVSTSLVQLTFFSLAIELGSVSINCGGSLYNNGSTLFERDLEEVGPSSYLLSSSNWEVSSTGHFLDDNISKRAHAAYNQSALTADTSPLDMDARISAISVTYYGFCLENGNYTIDLYFAETAFTNDNTYKSLGRRVFDVYIQVIYIVSI